MRTAVRFALAALLPTLLGGCAYDYLQHTDRVSYSSGDAVKANLQQQTINPKKPSMYLKGGLGKTGKVDPAKPGVPTDGPTP
jgi:hypothetical protein